MIEPLPPPTLPLTQSYVDALEKMRPEAPQRPPRQTWPTPETPITWPNDPDIPKDWTSAEIDLDPAYVSPFLQDELGFSMNCRSRANHVPPPQ